MKLVLLVVLVGVIAVSGCTSTGNVASFELLISDQPIAIGEFDELLVQITEATLFSNTGAPVTLTFSETVDLTQVVGDQAVPLITQNIPTGTYERISLSIATATGVVAGEEVTIEVPSNMLTFTKSFTVGEEPLSFVVDISVVNAGQSGMYILLPVISQTGVVGLDVAIQRGEIGADQKAAHADEILERARANLGRGDDALDQEAYENARMAYQAAEKGFAIAQARYQQARILGATAAENGFTIAQQSSEAANNMVRAVEAYQAGNNNMAESLGQQAASIINNLPLGQRGGNP